MKKNYKLIHYMTFLSCGLLSSQKLAQEKNQFKYELLEWLSAYYKKMNIKWMRKIIFMMKKSEYI
jgi:uncharacterized protein YeeX (DUF496 family)